MKQKYSSAATSINKVKLPAIYKYDFPENSTVIDYGCGKYTDHIKDFANENNIEWFGYDKYNQPEEVNNAIPEKADYCICSNVLNVIQEDNVVKEIIDKVVSLGNKAIFTVYEGNKTGIGKVTGKDQYQRNEKKSQYVDMIRNMGYNVKCKAKYIIIDKTSQN